MVSGEAALSRSAGAGRLARADRHAEHLGGARCGRAVELRQLGSSHRAARGFARQQRPLARGDEALALAKSTGKPIFLSIGYSACHWCHVMAHESFENAETAAIMNKHFINIKVDREERPDTQRDQRHALGEPHDGGAPRGAREPQQRRGDRRHAGSSGERLHE